MIQSTLISKTSINNKRTRWFFSKHYQTGIMWFRPQGEEHEKGSYGRNTEAIKYTYFQLQKPGMECGKWSEKTIQFFENPQDFVNKQWISPPKPFELDVWVSPCYTMNNRDSLYAITQPWRFAASLGTGLAYCKDKEEKKLLYKGLLEILMLCKGSSWKSTTIAADMRFISLGLVSGDRKSTRLNSSHRT